MNWPLRCDARSKDERMIDEAVCSGSARYCLDATLLSVHLSRLSMTYQLLQLLLHPSYLSFSSESSIPSFSVVSSPLGCSRVGIIQAVDSDACSVSPCDDHHGLESD